MSAVVFQEAILHIYYCPDCGNYFAIQYQREKAKHGRPKKVCIHHEETQVPHETIKEILDKFEAKTT